MWIISNCQFQMHPVCLYILTYKKGIYINCQQISMPVEMRSFKVMVINTKI